MSILGIILILNSNVIKSWLKNDINNTNFEIY